MPRLQIVSPTRRPSEAHYSTLYDDAELRLNEGVRLAGDTLEILSEIGSGSIAVVYEALDHTRGRRVAVKIGNAQSSTERTPQRFQRECRIGSMVGKHPHIVGPLRVGTLEGPSGFEGRTYLVTELVDGKPLDVIMAVKRHGLDPRRACAIGLGVAKALESLHAQGIVHRDVKPANIVVGGETPETAQLIDFGLAFVQGDDWAERTDGSSRTSGTALYMAPEQARGQRPSPEADIYAFGATLYELLCGSPPHDRLPNAELLTRKCDPTRPPMSVSLVCSDLSPEVATAIDQCLSYDPAARPAASDLVEILATASAKPEVLAPPPLEQPTRSPVLIVALLAAILAALVIIAMLLWSGRVPPPESTTRATTPPPTVMPEPSPDGAEPETANTVAHDPPAPVQPPVAPKREVELKPTPSPLPSQKELNSDLAACKGMTADAKKAAVASDWGRVLRLTRDRGCWRGTEAKRRALLRTQAYFETGRYAECARSGKSLKDPQGKRYVQLCQAKSDRGSP